jgi:ribosomal protein S18 acetylase RimI-like enzyme
LEGFEDLEYAIEEASLDDVEDILEVQRLAFTEEMKLYGLSDIPPLTDTAEDLREAFDGHVVLKAVSSVKIVGTVKGTLREGSCYVGRLAVRPDVWDRGIGTALMSPIATRCGDGRRLELFVGSKSTKNIHLYEKHRTFRVEDVGEGVQLLYIWRGSSARLEDEAGLAQAEASLLRLSASMSI